MQWYYKRKQMQKGQRRERWELYLSAMDTVWPLTLAVFPGMKSIVLRFSFDTGVTNEQVVMRHANVRVTLPSVYWIRTDTCRLFVFTCSRKNWHWIPYLYIYWYPTLCHFIWLFYLNNSTCFGHYSPILRSSYTAWSSVVYGKCVVVWSCGLISGG
jgi:hypothetical protein